MSVWFDLSIATALQYICTSFENSLLNIRSAESAPTLCSSHTYMCIFFALPRFRIYTAKKETCIANILHVDIRLGILFKDVTHIRKIREALRESVNSADFHARFTKQTPQCNDSIRPRRNKTLIYTARYCNMIPGWVGLAIFGNGYCIEYYIHTFACGRWRARGNMIKYIREYIHLSKCNNGTLFCLSVLCLVATFIWNQFRDKFNVVRSENKIEIQYVRIYMYMYVCVMLFWDILSVGEILHKIILLNMS